jgi:hypothetical protein
MAQPPCFSYATNNSSLQLDMKHDLSGILKRYNTKKLSLDIPAM